MAGRPNASGCRIPYPLPSIGVLWASKPAYEHRIKRPAVLPGLVGRGAWRPLYLPEVRLGLPSATVGSSRVNCPRSPPNARWPPSPAAGCRRIAAMEARNLLPRPVEHAGDSLAGAAVPTGSRPGRRSHRCCARPPPAVPSCTETPGRRLTPEPNRTVTTTVVDEHGHVSPPNLESYAHSWVK